MLPALGLLVAMEVITYLLGIRTYLLYEDAAQAMGAPAYFGLFANLNLVLWGVGATICLLGGALLRGRPDQQALRRFLLQAGLLTILLLLDDLAMLHDEAIPYLLRFLPYEAVETSVYGIYMLLALGLLVRHRLVIRETNYLMLGLTLLCFGLSIIADISGAPGIFDEGFKFLGIVAWLAYFGQGVHRALRLPPQPEAGPSKS